MANREVRWRLFPAVLQVGQGLRVTGRELKDMQGHNKNALEIGERVARKNEGKFKRNKKNRKIGRKDKTKNKKKTYAGRYREIATDCEIDFRKEESKIICVCVCHRKMF